MNKVILGIDPGKNGGIAWDYNGTVACENMPETDGDKVDKVKYLTSLEGDKVCYIEKVGGYGGNDASTGSAMFGFGEGRGVLIGALMALNWRILCPIPRKWQERLGLGTASSCKDKTEWKNKLKAEAQRRFPDKKVTLKTADALLILDYAIEQERK